MYNVEYDNVKSKMFVESIDCLCKNRLNEIITII